MHHIILYFLVEGGKREYLVSAKFKKQKGTRKGTTYFNHKEKNQLEHASRFGKDTLLSGADLKFSN